MIIFLYGTDPFRIRRKLSEIRQRYLEKAKSDLNLAVFDCAEVFDPNDFARSQQTQPFLASSRLLIVRNPLSALPRDKQEKLAEVLGQIPPTTIVVVSEDKSFDRRLKLYHRLLKADLKTEFRELSGESLVQWIVRLTTENEGRISRAGARLLIDFIGPNLERASREIAKLVDYAGGDLIDEEKIRALVQPEVTGDIFALVDAIAFRSQYKAAEALERLRLSGEADLKILAMVVYGLRNLLVVKDYLGLGWGHQQIHKSTHLHPYVLTKTLAATRRFELEELKQFFGQAADCDRRIKTGKIKPSLGLDLLIFQMLSSQT